MNEQQLTRIFAELVERFEPTRQVKRSFESAFNEIWHDLLAIHEDALEPGLKRLKTTTNYLPSAAKVLQAFEVEGKLAAKNASLKREREWEKTKDTAKGQGGNPKQAGTTTVIPAHLQDEHAQMAAQVFGQMGRHDKSHQEKLEFFRVMEGRYPGVGWAEAGMQLQRFWEKSAMGQEARL